MTVSDFLFSRGLTFWWLASQHYWHAHLYMSIKKQHPLKKEHSYMSCISFSLLFKFKIDRTWVSQEGERPGWSLQAVK